MIDSIADAGWLAEIGALDAPGAAAVASDGVDILASSLFTDDPNEARTPIGAIMDNTAARGVEEFTARVLAHLSR